MMMVLLQGCVAMEIAGQHGILVTGGYYNGVSSMFLPLEDRGGRSLETFGNERNMPRWEYVGGLTKVGRYKLNCSQYKELVHHSFAAVKICFAQSILFPLLCLPAGWRTEKS